MTDQGQGRPHSEWGSPEWRRRGLADAVLNQPAGPPSRNPLYPRRNRVGAAEGHSEPEPREMRERSRCHHDIRPGQPTSKAPETLGDGRASRPSGQSGGDRRSGIPPVARLMGSRSRGQKHRWWCPVDGYLASRLICHSVRHRSRVGQNSSVCDLISGDGQRVGRRRGGPHKDDSPRCDPP